MSKGLKEMSTEELSAFIDDHIVMALHGADLMYAGARQEAEDYVGDRLVALSDSFEPKDLAAEHVRRRTARVLTMLKGED